MEYPFRIGELVLEFMYYWYWSVDSLLLSCKWTSTDGRAHACTEMQTLAHDDPSVLPCIGYLIYLPVCCFFSLLTAFSKDSVGSMML